ncbi:MAG: hypothetical protein KKH01_03175, partial [Firmicutes bacterium]|nr:hypothetical protein [Bacillota bacterium]
SIKTRLRVSKGDKGNWANKKTLKWGSPVASLVGVGEKPRLEGVDFYLITYSKSFDLYFLVLC